MNEIDEMSALHGVISAHVKRAMLDGDPSTAIDAIREAVDEELACQRERGRSGHGGRGERAMRLGDEPVTAAVPRSERESLLMDATDVVCGGRERQYGTPERVFGSVAAMWSAYLCREVGARDVANMMVLLKVARNARGGHRDNWVDIAGYAACGAECEEGDVA